MCHICSNCIRFKGKYIFFGRKTKTVGHADESKTDLMCTDHIVVTVTHQHRIRRIIYTEGVRWFV